ncbi:hypothetical protein GR7B_00070 [Vibrio phage vB_VcorM_GR7B]|nr:hypothetical protein GR7B_00070 [Vibrio phage vB_VcorM_GR7B]
MAKPYIKNNRFWIPVSEVLVSQIKKHFVLEMGESHVENEYYEEAQIDIIKLYLIEKKKGERWCGIPMGRPDLIKRCLKKPKMFDKALKNNDQRTIQRMRKKISFLFDLRKYQGPAVKSLIKSGNGVLKAPPRSGKCVVEGTLIHTNHGLIPIEKMFSPKHKEGHSRELSEESKLRVRTDNPVHTGRVTHLHKKRAETTVTLKTSRGRKVTGTPEHPVQILRPNMALEWCRLDEVKEGDTIIGELGNYLFPKVASTVNLPPKTPNFYPRKCKPELAELLLYTGYAEAHYTHDHDPKDDVTLALGRHNSSTVYNEALVKRFITLIELMFKYKPFHMKGTNIVRIKYRTFKYLMLNQGFVTKVPDVVMQTNKYGQQRYLRAWFAQAAKFSVEGSYIELRDDCRDKLKIIQIMLGNFGVDCSLDKCLVDPLAGITHGWSLVLGKEDYARAVEALKIKTGDNYHLWTPQPCGINPLRKVIPGLGKWLVDKKLKWTWWERNVKKRNVTPTATHGDIRRIVEELGLLWDFADEEEARMLTLASCSGSMSFDTVTCVHTNEEPTTVYDLTVDDVHNFTANGLRVHNTVMATALTCKKRAKTLILAHQSDLIDQFYETFQEMTDVKDVEKFNGVKLCGICNSVADFHKYDICLATYQMFLPQNGGKKKLKKVRDLFEVIIVDEIHKAPADGYSNILSQFNAMHFYGLTGTPDRKDGKYPVTDRIFGKIAYECKVETMTPVTHIHKTGIAKKNYQQWQSAMKHLSEHKDRNQMIVDQAIKDMKKGHSVIIPVTFQAHANLLVDMVNEQWDGDEEQIALAFTGRIPKHKRKDVLDSLRDGTYRCTVAMRSMLTGVNVPLWSAIYTIIPISNVPNYTQEVTRVMTPMEGKCQPIIRAYVDETWGLALGCFATCWKTLKDYKLHKKSRETLGEVFGELKNKGSRSGDPDDQYKPTKAEHGKKKPTKKLRF